VKKLTKAKLEQLKEEHRLFNKEMRRQNRHKELVTFEEFVAVRFGKVPKSESTATYSFPEPVRRDTKAYSSIKVSGDLSEACIKRESKTYSGTLVKGIATMHKSNAVPVISQEEAEDIAKMRRN
jgi:hypothetical protein